MINKPTFLVARRFFGFFRLGCRDRRSGTSLNQPIIRTTAIAGVPFEVVVVGSSGRFRREINRHISMGKLNAFCSKTLLDAPVHFVAYDKLGYINILDTSCGMMAITFITFFFPELLITTSTGDNFGALLYPVQMAAASWMDAF